jgi:hypothetical protein
MFYKIELYTYYFASALQNHRVAPDTVLLTDPFSPSHEAKPALLMDTDAGLILWKDAGLKGPDTIVFALMHQFL